MIVSPDPHASTTTKTPLPSPVTGFHKHHEVEGRNRSALSFNLLKQHLKEFKFERIESYTDVTHAEATTTTSDSSSSFCSDEEETISVRRRSILASPCVRSKFLNKLGIAPQQMPETSPRRKDFAPKQSFTEPSYEMPLNDNSNGNEQETSELGLLLKRGLFFFQQRSSSLSSSPEILDSNNMVDAHETTNESQGTVRSVRFSETVQVHPVLKHTAFSNRIRETIWTSAQEMEENVARNCIEFAAEEWDWTRVLEDQDMIVYHGELVHPVHFAMQEEDE